MEPVAPQVTEITGSCRFVSLQSLHEHAVKHIIDSHEERWHAVVEPELLWLARDERSRGEFGPSCKKISKKYWDLLSDALQQACTKGTSHCHWATFTITEDEEVSAYAQEVTAWPAEHRLFILANSFVRNGGQGAYKIVTGYRMYPRIGPKAFARAAREKILDRQHQKGRKLLALHDNEE